MTVAQMTNPVFVAYATGQPPGMQVTVLLKAGVTYDQQLSQDGLSWQSVGAFTPHSDLPVTFIMRFSTLSPASPLIRFVSP